jgi:hypothetical protein
MKQKTGYAIFDDPRLKDLKLANFLPPAISEAWNAMNEKKSADENLAAFEKRMKENGGPKFHYEKPIN